MKEYTTLAFKALSRPSICTFELRTSHTSQLTAQHGISGVTSCAIQEIIPLDLFEHFVQSRRVSTTKISRRSVITNCDHAITKRLSRRPSSLSLLLSSAVRDSNSTSDSLVSRTHTTCRTSSTTLLYFRHNSYVRNTCLHPRPCVSPTT